MFFILSFPLVFFTDCVKKTRCFMDSFAPITGPLTYRMSRPCSRAIGNVREVARLLSKHMRLGEKSLVFFCGQNRTALNVSLRYFGLPSPKPSFAASSARLTRWMSFCGSSLEALASRTFHARRWRRVILRWIWIAGGRTRIFAKQRQKGAVAGLPFGRVSVGGRRYFTPFRMRFQP